MQFHRERFNPRGQDVGQRRQVRVLTQQREHGAGVLRGKHRQRFPVPGVGFRARLVALGLAGLSQQYQRGGIAACRLNARFSKMKGYKSNRTRPLTLAMIQSSTTTVCAPRDIGVPKNPGQAGQLS